MRPRKQESIWVESQYLRGWLCYCAALIAIAMLSNVSSMEVWTHNLADAAKSLPYSDPNSFAAAARDVSSQGWITDNTRWVLNLWPPGFVLLEAGLLKLFGSNAPMPLLLLAFSASMFAIVMMEMRRILAASFGQWAWFMPTLVFCFPEARIFLLSPAGLLFGEWLAIASFLWAFLLLMRVSLKEAMFAGVLFAISAYARSQFELFLNVILLVSVGSIAASHYFNKPRNSHGRHVGRFLLISMVVAQVIMLPWRLYHFHDGNGFRWVQTSTVIAQNGLTTDSVLQEKGGGFVVEGGGNVACRIAPEHCGETNPRIYFNIFFEHPFTWIKEKIQLLPKYWFASASSYARPSSGTSLLEIALEGILLICLFLSGALLWGARRTSAAYLWACVGLGLLMAHSAIVVFAHLEVRYFFFAKIFGVFSFLLLLGLIVEIRKKKSTEISRDHEILQGAGGYK